MKGAKINWNVIFTISPQGGKAPNYFPGHAKIPIPNPL